MIANVAGNEVGEKLRKLSSRWRTAPRWAASVRSQAGVSNLYDDPSQLGVDRWAALIGARKYCSDPCVVVNAGTATTVDALKVLLARIGQGCKLVASPMFDTPEMREELTEALREAIAAQDGPRLVQVPVASGMWLD